MFVLLLRPSSGKGGKLKPVVLGIYCQDLYELIFNIRGRLQGEKGEWMSGEP